MATTETLLELDHMGVKFASRRWGGEPFVALADFNLTVDAARPRIIAIAGESGSGKTTLGRVILGMQEATDGSMRYLGKRRADMSAAERASFRREVQAIFQDPFSVFNPFYSVDHLLHMPLKAFGIGGSRRERIEMVTVALERVGLRPDQVLGRHPHQLSGGQRQRIVVARSLMLKPRLIVADEPVSMIDASLRANILGQIEALRDELGISIIYITHDLATARQVSDEIYVLNHGQTVESGPADQVISAPQHPYTRLLLSSIPRPDPDFAWGEVRPAAAADVREAPLG